MGKIIDAEFRGTNAGDRYCASCRERFPKRSALCPRCGGALTLWATHSASERQQAARVRKVKAVAALLCLLAALIVAIVLRSVGAVF